MQIHLIQTDIRWEQKEANFGLVRSHFDQLAPTAGSLVLLPEMFATGFSMSAAEIAEEPKPDAPTTRFLLELAAESGCCVIGGVPTATGGQYFNDAVVALPSGGTIRYRKHQLFTLGGEAEAYQAGDLLNTFGWGGWCVGLSICYDLRFPELYRALAFDGAGLLVNIANWPQKRIGHWTTLLKARAIENQCYVAGLNRVGADPNSTYVGGSIIVDPHGEVIADAGDRECAISADLDLDLIDLWRKEFPALADARDEELCVHHSEPEAT